MAPDNRFANRDADDDGSRERDTRIGSNRLGPANSESPPSREQDYGKQDYGKAVGDALRKSPTTDRSGTSSPIRARVLVGGAVGLLAMGGLLGLALSGGGGESDSSETATAEASAPEVSTPEGGQSLNEDSIADEVVPADIANTEIPMADEAMENTPLELSRSDEDGSFIKIESGTVFLEGAMADQASIDRMLISLSGLETPVVNNLTVDAEAPGNSGRVVIANDVFFASGSEELRDIDRATVDSIVGLCLARPDLILTVVGHTDSVGDEVENMDLSIARATSVRDLLITEGVPAEVLRVGGAGETEPMASNETEAGRAENRRIEFRFSEA